jgi:hypothetical protein
MGHTCQETTMVGNVAISGGQVVVGDGHAADATRETSRGAARWRPIAALALVLLGGLILAGAMVREAMDRQALPNTTVVAPAPTLTEGVAVMPAVPSEGVLTLVIPPGAAANQQAGGPGYLMPSVISLRVGDTIVLRNDDEAPHMILHAFLMPGETQERTFTAPGSEVYSSGCGLHAASFLNFTTIFVNDSA